jgi:hypothetical protein
VYLIGDIMKRLVIIQFFLLILNPDPLVFSYWHLCFGPLTGMQDSIARFIHIFIECLIMVIIDHFLGILKTKYKNDTQYPICEVTKALDSKYLIQYR